MAIECDERNSNDRSRRSLTILFAFLISISIATSAFSKTEKSQQNEEEIMDSTKRGLIGIMISYLTYHGLQGSNTHMSRPHPALWRIVRGSFEMYFLFLVFLLFHDRDEVLKIFMNIDRALGDDLEEKTYAEDCSISMKAVQEKVFDEFFVAHVLGWFGKALAIRDWRLLWTYSVLFEVCEVTFKHLLRNFNECWWDAIVLDVLVCNLFGMFCGMKATEYFATGGSSDCRTEEDSAERICNNSNNNFNKLFSDADETEEELEEEEEEEEDSTIDERKKSRRSLMMMRNSSAKGVPDVHNSSVVARVARKSTNSIKNYILPKRGRSWYRYKWEPFHSPQRFIQCLFLIGLCLSFELNAFFLKFIYGIPPPHMLNTIRLALWFAEANIAIREYYVFITSEAGIWNTKLGANAWLTIAAMATEFLLIIKHGEGLFTASWPKAVVLWWSIVGYTVASGLLIWQFLRSSSRVERNGYNRRRRNRGGLKSN